MREQAERAPGQAFLFRPKEQEVLLAMIVAVRGCRCLKL